MDGGDEPTPVGAILDTNSNGRFDLVIYEDGLLAVKGTYVGVMLRAAGVGIGGAGPAVGWSSGSKYETKRLAERLRCGREQLVHREPNFFVTAESIVGLALRKRWHGHSLIVRTHEHTEGRRFDWKPRLNSFPQVEGQLWAAFPNLVHRE
jgi:hypothetical protein